MEKLQSIEHDHKITVMPNGGEFSSMYYITICIIKGPPITTLRLAPVAKKSPLKSNQSKTAKFSKLCLQASFASIAIEGTLSTLLKAVLLNDLV